jgi:translocation and assembly module TamA
VRVRNFLLSIDPGSLPAQLPRWRHSWLLTLFLLLLLSASALAAEPLKIEVDGVSNEEALANVQAALVLPPGLVRDNRVDVLWLERFEEQLPERVRQALEPYGYYESEVSIERQMKGAENYLLQVTVVTGEPIRLTTVQVRLSGAGASEPRLLALVGTFPLHPGDVLRQDIYETAKGALKARVLDLGYLDATFTVQQIRLQRQERRAEIDLELTTGERYHFGAVRIEGGGDYPEPFLRRYISFSAGEVFSYPSLGQTQLNFLDSDRFREVIITPQKNMAEAMRVPISLKLVPSARRRLRPGIGYGTDTGARMSLNYRDLNVFHRGHEFNTDLSIAERRQSLTANYILPGLLNLDSQTALRTGFIREDLNTFVTRSLFAEIEEQRGFGGGRVGSVYLRLLQENFIVGDQDDRSRMILPGVRFRQSSYADPIRPKQGFRYSLEARGGHQALGSDTGLLQLLASGNTVIPLPWQLKLLLRTQGGTTWKNEPLAEVPASLRFFAGGDQSIRGYAYQSLGPTDASGKVVGGEHLAVGSVEIEAPLGEDWGVAAFFDLGSAFNSVTAIDWARGAGIGVRRYTVVGPVKIDIARQVGIVNPSYRLHLSVGFGW